MTKTEYAILDLGEWETMFYCPTCKLDVSDQFLTLTNVHEMCGDVVINLGNVTMADMQQIVMEAEKRGADQAIVTVREWADTHLKLCDEMVTDARKRYDYLALERWEGSATTIRVLLESIGGKDSKND